MHSLGTKDTEELTHFLCFVVAPTRWEISCMYLALTVSPAKDINLVGLCHRGEGIFMFPTCLARSAGGKEIIRAWGMKQRWESGG